jgi:hypothetical protein
MIFVEKTTKRQLGNIRHFETVPFTKADGISVILGQHFGV